MILIIDNYDSFTYNIYHYLGEIGAKIKVIRNDQYTVDKIIQISPQAIILSPGPKTPNEAGICLKLLKKNKDIPILGICLGHQAIGQSYGGAIVQSKEILHGKIDNIYHNKHKLFKGIEKKFKATRYHSLIIDKNSLPSELTIIAETANKTIMGIAHKNKKIFGVQFHPESIGTIMGKIIFQNFLKIINYEF